jgi:hypothetical protein
LTGRLCVTPGSSRCFPRQSAPAPRANTVCAPLVVGSRGVARWTPLGARGRGVGRWTRLDARSPGVTRWTSLIARGRGVTRWTSLVARDIRVTRWIPSRYVVARTGAVDDVRVLDRMRTARSGAHTVSARGTGADWRGKQREDPGLARRRPTASRERRDRGGERDMSFRTGGAASTCPGRTRVAGTRCLSAPVPRPMKPRPAYLERATCPRSSTYLKHATCPRSSTYLKHATCPRSSTSRERATCSTSPKPQGGE